MATPVHSAEHYLTKAIEAEAKGNIAMAEKYLELALRAERAANS